MIPFFIERGMMLSNNEDKLKKIKYIKEKISTIDEQIAELVDERFGMGDVLFEYIYKNNIDLIDKKCNQIDFSEKTMEYDEYITEFLDYLTDISEKRNNYILKKYNSRYAYVGDKSNYDLTKFIYEKFLDEKYYRFKPEEDLLSNLLMRKNFVGLNIASPYKSEIIKYLDNVTDQVQEIKEVNLVQFYRNRKFGFNTEYFGIIKLLQRHDIDLKFKNILIIKKDESTKTIEYVLKSLNAGNVVIHDLNNSNIIDLKNFDIVFNLTKFSALEVAPEINFAESNLEFLIDISTSTIFSKLYLDAKNHGIKVINGVYKTMYQEKKSIEILSRKRFNDAEFEKIVTEFVKSKLNIVLVGMPGAGKTTIGKKLAKILDRKHIDLDKEFANEYGISPSKYLLERSEESFREKESLVVKKLANLTNAVISTSGGVVQKLDNYYYLKTNSIIFRIDRDLEKLSTKNRPLSSGGIETLQRMHNEREEKYKYFTDFVVKNYGDFNGVAYIIAEQFKDLEFWLNEYVLKKRLKT